MKQKSAISMIKKKQFFLGILLVGVSLGLLIHTGMTQQESHESVVINVEVPVRVYEGGKFVDHLTIDDFEVYENGILQKIEAVYLVNRRSVERSEEKKRFMPKTTRTFILMFEISEYYRKLGETVDYFYQNIFVPGDSLIVITPLKTYRLSPHFLKMKSRDELADDLKFLLRTDAKKGNLEYEKNIKELETLAQAMSSQIDQTGTVPTYEQKNENIFPLEKNLMRYAALLREQKKLRKVDQEKLLGFAKYLKKKEGQKCVFLFYQREFIPQIEPQLLDQCMHMYQDRPNVQHTLSDLFEFSRRDIIFDVDLVKQTFADASIAIHFLFITQPKKYIPGVYVDEQSDDIFGPFKEMALASGGFVESSANPHHSFRKALDASENYYLLYYSPKNYKRNNEFKDIKVKVRNDSYTIKHRMGYYAN